MAAAAVAASVRRREEGRKRGRSRRDGEGRRIPTMEVDDDSKRGSEEMRRTGNAGRGRK